MLVIEWAQGKSFRIWERLGGEDREGVVQNPLGRVPEKV